MINDYIYHSRFSKPADPGMCQQYASLYQSLTKLLSDDVPVPEFFVTYSMNRVCENVDIDGKKYIIYDQYMGQSIAQLNRILFFGAEPDELMMAYAYKFVSEDAFLRGNLERAYIFAKSRNSILDRLGEARFSVSRLASNDRLLIGVCQECFIMAHEIGHQATDSPLFTSDLISEEWEDVRSYYIGLIEKVPSIRSDLMSSGFRKLQRVLNRRLKAHSREERLSSINRVLDRLGPVIVPEIVSDRLVCHLTAKVMQKEWELSPFLLYFGILLAFRYMRIFQYLRNASAFLRQTGRWSPHDKTAVEAAEKGMLNYLMTGPSGLQSYFAWQVREKMLRRELVQSISNLNVTEIEKVNREAQKHIFFCEEHMADEIAFFVPLNIARGAPLYYESKVDVERSALRNSVLHLLGWP